MWAFLLPCIKVWVFQTVACLRSPHLCCWEMMLVNDDTGFTVFIPSLGGGHLECFSFLTLINNAPVNMHIRVS